MILERYQRKECIYNSLDVEKNDFDKCGNGEKMVLFKWQGSKEWC